MSYLKTDTLYFTESTNADLTHYEIEVHQYGEQVGSTQIISTDDTDDGYDENAGEIELYLGSLTAFPTDAVGTYTIYVYAVDTLGRSELPLNIFQIDVDFTIVRLFPTDQNKVGVLLKNSTEPYYSSLYPNGDRP